jgi:hypothetical protein
MDGASIGKGSSARLRSSTVVPPSNTTGRPSSCVHQRRPTAAPGATNGHYRFFARSYLGCSGEKLWLAVAAPAWRPRPGTDHRAGHVINHRTLPCQVSAVPVDQDLYWL